MVPTRIYFNKGIHVVPRLTSVHDTMLRKSKMSRVVKTNLSLFQSLWTWSGCGTIGFNEDFQVKTKLRRIGCGGMMSGVGGIVFLTVGLGLSLLVSQHRLNNLWLLRQELFTLWCAVIVDLTGVTFWISSLRLELLSPCVVYYSFSNNPF